CHKHHAVVDDRRRLMALRLPGGKTPNRLQPAHVVAVDRFERTVTPAVIGAAKHQPVAVLRRGPAHTSAGCPASVPAPASPPRARWSVVRTLRICLSPRG